MHLAERLRGIGVKGHSLAYPIPAADIMTPLEKGCLKKN